MYSRATSVGSYKTLLSSLQGNYRNIQNLQKQLATLKKYSNLSENPSAISRALELQSAIGANEDYKENGENAVALLKHAEGVLDQVLNAAKAIRTLVIQAGDAALSKSDREIIAKQIEANRQTILDALNTKVAGQYLFGGTSTGEAPFVLNADGTLTYRGTDERIKYALSNVLTGDVSFTGSEVLPNKEKAYFVCSHYVPLDWQWKGREEKVQITVGNRTISVFIPERWIDEVATGKTKPTDYNQFRDPGEVSGISLDDLAALVNRSLEEQGADMLVRASVEKDLASGRQQMVIKSHTGEKVGITGWPTTDYTPMPQSIAGIQFKKTGTTAGGNLKVETPNWNASLLGGTADISLSGLKDKALTVVTTAKDGTQEKKTYTFAADPANVKALLDELNTAGVLPAGVTASSRNGKLVLTSADGKSIRVDGTAAEQLFGAARRSEAAKYSGLMGKASVLGWRDDSLGKGITVNVDGKDYDFEFAGMRSISDLVAEINKKIPVDAGDVPVASVVAGRLVLQSSRGQVTVKDHGAAGGVQQLFGEAGPVKSSTSSLSVKVGDKLSVTVYVNEGDTLTDVAEKLNAIEGVYSRTSADADQLVAVAKRVGELPADGLSTNAAAESLHYPSLTITGSGGALALFDFTFAEDAETGEQRGVIASKPQTRPVDHSHMDVFDVLGMETALKSVEFENGRTLKVGQLKDPTKPYDPKTNPYQGKPLHWRVMSGGHTADITLNPGEYTMDDLAARIRNAGAGWLDVTVDVYNKDGRSEDGTESGLGTSYNGEKATQRLVIRGLKGEQVLFLDMNDQHYADEMGLSTSLRTTPDMGVKSIVFPEAPCVDDELGVKVRVQMNCGKTYDVNITKKAVVDPATGEVDRVKVMREIVNQVNAQEGSNVMGLTVPVDKNGAEIPHSASIHFLSGEPFSVVDLPFSDPEWSDYAGGIAAQLGIHGGVSANLKRTEAPMKDGQKFGASGVLRFESLGRSVTIDVSENDTVKDVMDRLRSQAKDWLYVNYFDAHLGQEGRQSGDYPILSIAAKDGSAVNVVDVKGTIAKKHLGLSTGIQGEKDVSGMEWSVGETEGSVFSITVAGYTHTIDMTAMRDVNGNGKMDAKDLVATINARMQDYDVKAELNDEGRLVLWSPRGYSIRAEVTKVKADGTPMTTSGDRTAEFFGGTASEVKTCYRGGYKLDDPANTRKPQGIFVQNTTNRSGANERKQNGYEMFGDVTAAVRAGNRTGLSEVMLPRIDAFIDNVLSVLSSNGAMQNRYKANMDRLTTENTLLTETHDELATVDPAEIATQLMMANYVYQSNLAVIAQLIQPSLLDFIR